MRFGIDVLLWSDTLCDELLPIVDEVKAIGYDIVELPAFEYDPKKYAAWGRRLDDAGLERTAVTVCGPDANPISPDPKIRSKGVDWLKGVLDCSKAVGAGILAGPSHSALGVFSGAGPTADEWKWGVESMRQAAEHADELGVTIAVEYLNRFECYFLNSAADAARFCRDVDHPRCRMMYDTFHSHIEEKSTPAAIRVAGTTWSMCTSPRMIGARPDRGTSGGMRPSTPSTRSATTTRWSSKPSDYPLRSWCPPARSGGACIKPSTSWPPTRCVS